MKKVLHFFWSGTIGGAPRAVYQLIRHQLKEGKYEPNVLFASPHGYYYELIKELGVNIIEIELRTDKQITKIPKIINLIKSYDIHHFHSPELVFMLSSLFCRNSKRVFTQRAGCVEYKGKQKIRYAIAKRIIKYYFDGVSGNSSHACQGLHEKWYIEKSRIFLTYNGIEFSLLNAEREKGEVLEELGVADEILIATSADLRRWKRIELLIEACSLLKDMNFKLVIIGKGPDKERLENIVLLSGLKNKTIFTGEKKIIGDYLNAIDIFVQPSSSHESFGNSTVEAMYHKKPCIAFSDGGGLIEHIVDAETGFIVDSVEQLSHKLKELIEDNELRSKFGENGQKRVMERYSTVKMLENYNKLYEFVLKKI